MKKKIGLGCIILWEVWYLITVYGIGGWLAPWLWNASIFVIAPISCVSFLIQLVVGGVRLCRHKSIRWNLCYLVMTMILAYPITILAENSVLTYPTSSRDTPVVTMQKPIEEGVLFGGKTYKTHAVWPSECYAYDILKEPYETGSHQLKDYGIYLEDVAAPVYGTIIGMREDEPDIAPNTEEFSSALGNYIYIKIEETGTYLILAHLEKDSIQVETGDNITEGEIIAKVGNSGTTSEPHLHIQHQKNDPRTVRIPICAEGLPILFENE